MLDKNGADTDQDLIERVIAADLDSYLSKDKARWSEQWVQDDRMTSIMECGTLQVARGFEAFSANIFVAMDESPAPSRADVRREKLDIHVRGDLGWATFDQIVKDADDPMAPPNYSHNFRLLERIEGEWKIVFHGVWSHSARDATRPMIEVDEDANVLWLNPAAAERLKGFPGLTISAGKLRATRPVLDKELRQTIHRAAELKVYGRYNASVENPERPVTFPVLLGEDDDGAVLLCSVLIADGRQYVSFDHRDNLDHQIAMASVVYGLSEAQSDLARQIASGHDLPEAAANMGVSLNTARTHLRRMFDKTGARSQIALLRVFLGFS